MLGAIQLGGLAACIVVLVPMALAGWHLSRNKMLFFSGALFISLAIVVHLSPYFPSFNDFLPKTISSSSTSTLVVLENHESCLSFLHRIEWKNHPRSMNVSSSWKWMVSDENVLACDFQKLGRNDVGDLLNGSWIVVAGDSQARLFVVSLLNLMLFEDEMVSVRGELFKRHSDYYLVVDRVGLKLDFIWAPYVSNLTHLAMELNRNHSFPDVLVMGSGLWHMLHVNNSTHYDASLRLLSRSVMPLSVGKSQPHLFWLEMPTLINSMLNTEEKREKMTRATQFAYHLGLRNAKVLRPGGPFVLLDIQSLSENCGEKMKPFALVRNLEDLQLHLSDKLIVNIVLSCLGALYAYSPSVSLSLLPWIAGMDNNFPRIIKVNIALDNIQLQTSEAGFTWTLVSPDESKACFPECALQLEASACLLTLSSNISSNSYRVASINSRVFQVTLVQR